MFFSAGAVLLAGSLATRRTEAGDERAALSVQVPVEGAIVAPTEGVSPSLEQRFARTFDITKFRRGNIHTHTNRSDGDSNPSAVYAWYRDHGYDFVAITDHNTFTDPDNYKLNDGPLFVVLGGEEITMVGGGRQIHVNALCTDRRLPGGKFLTAQSALAFGVGEIREVGGVALINHPNFTWALTPTDLPAALGAQLLEIHSGHPLVHSSGNGSHPSEEALWDMALTAGLDFMGVAVDDAHHLRDSTRSRLSHPGHAWVEVFSDSLDKEAICQALSEGMLYSSTGPSLSRIAVTEDTYWVWPVDQGTEVQFIGAGGRVLVKRKLGANEPFASYRILGSERYVRARIFDAQGRTAWTPAVRISGTGQANTTNRGPGQRSPG